MTMAQWGMNERTNERTNQANNEIGSTSPFDLYCHSVRPFSFCFLPSFRFPVRMCIQLKRIPPTPFNGRNNNNSNHLSSSFIFCSFQQPESLDRPVSVD
jgi:hypothetical protein